MGRVPFKMNFFEPDRIKVVIDRKIGKISIREILEACSDISKVTVERDLTALVKKRLYYQDKRGTLNSI